MPDTRRITMRQIKDVLRLKLELHHSHQHIAASLGISKGVVAKYLKLASAAGLQWAQIPTMDETALHSRLMGAPQRASAPAALWHPTMPACTRSSSAKA